jgi:outer membrane protein assembly factor BamA
MIQRQAKTLDGDGNVVDDVRRGGEDRDLQYLQAELAYVFDNALWGPTGPLDGSRARLSVQMMPPVMQEEYGYTRLRADMRHYLRFSGLFALAMRGSAGISLDWQGVENPYTFYAGGEENTLNYRYNSRNVGMDLPDLYFAEWDLPLRGYGYLQFKGHKDLLGSLELRYPFIEHLRFGFPFPEFRYVMGTLFLDAGGAWTSGNWRDQMGAGTGWGLRLNLGGLILRWTQAWPLWAPAGGPGNLQPAPSEGSVQYWSLGADF